jgi:hypothetical protein
MDNYQQLLDRVARSAKLSNEDVERKIEAKRAKLSGLISREGAAQIVAAELGVSLDGELLNLSELVEGMKRAHVIGKITSVLPVRSYSKNGREGKVANFFLGDDSSNVRVVLWDSHHIELIENKSLEVGSVIEIFNASVRNGELHLAAFSDIKPSNRVFDEVKLGRVARAGFFSDAQQGALISNRAVIVQVFDPKYFDDKKDPSQKRVLVNVVLDDGTETMRAVFGISQLQQLGFSHEEMFSPESFSTKKSSLFGEEYRFTGSYKLNTYFNKLELSIERIEPINAEILIRELESNL